MPCTRETAEAVRRCLWRPRSGARARTLDAEEPRPASGRAPCQTLTFWDGSTDARATLDGLSQCGGFSRRHLDDQAATALDGHAQHDATAFLGDLKRPVPGPRLHRRHG